MSIERKCENCAYEKRCPKYFQNYWVEICKAYKLFVPKEEVVRQDERNKTINYLIELLTDDDNDAISIQTKEGKLYKVKVDYLCDYLWEPKTNKLIIGR